MTAAPFTLVRARVAEVTRPAAAFLRVVFAGPELGRAGGVPDTGTGLTRHLDRRIKIIVPGPRGLPAIADDADWYHAWLAEPAEERGFMRTYSIRELSGNGEHTRLTVDFVVHGGNAGHGGHAETGPALRWALHARPGDEVLLVLPRRGVARDEGVEFAPGAARSIVLVGDETAAPAVARILEDLAQRTRGAHSTPDGPAPRLTALLELPGPGTAPGIAHGPGAAVHWLPRRPGEAPGAQVLPALRALLRADGAGHADGGERDVVNRGCPTELPETADGLPWAVPGAAAADDAADDTADVEATYWWVAGESGLVKSVRRLLVREAGVDRSRVAFMGYWRTGVAMRG
ncbi:hypothetical protein CFRA_02665 [Corynebacterium frankenforstense DSM 45800]|uniref:FAD-binding FR-type domain-containing protein n=1 Tax=Corynebacterium frankenforstense DSM 45800 TaxID=1437875 RepID=A0A1L7CR98_9CORY|nr:siderophore-interacting protein [Corynebacterium frankenforstense]APT88357.1 hypothetical protein CFRA_02665 [Corynebacterium frankenforstense DSM 45800]